MAAILSSLFASTAIASYIEAYAVTIQFPEGQTIAQKVASAINHVPGSIRSKSVSHRKRTRVRSLPLVAYGSRRNALNKIAKALWPPGCKFEVRSETGACIRRDGAHKRIAISLGYSL